MYSTLVCNPSPQQNQLMTMFLILRRQLRQMRATGDLAVQIHSSLGVPMYGTYEPSRLCKLHASVHLRHSLEKGIKQHSIIYRNREVFSTIDHKATTISETAVGC